MSILIVLTNSIDKHVVISQRNFCNIVNLLSNFMSGQHPLTDRQAHTAELIKDSNLTSFGMVAENRSDCLRDGNTCIIFSKLCRKPMSSM
jgi:hypothetical protein